jgi:HAD superfamily phosphatase (TIGR01668 family)
MAPLSPDTYCRTVQDIDLDALSAAGIDTLLLDLDNTLLPRDSAEIPPSARRWADELHRRGFHVCLVSNNWHQRVKTVADELDFCLVAKALKPLPFGFRKGLEAMGSTPERSAIVGDQLFTDILGGRLLGVHTILVMPLSEADLPHTLLLRRVERRLLRDQQPQP